MVLSKTTLLLSLFKAEIFRKLIKKRVKTGRKKLKINRKGRLKSIIKQISKLKTGLKRVKNDQKQCLVRIRIPQ